MTTKGLYVYLLYYESIKWELKTSLVSGRWKTKNHSWGIICRKSNQKNLDKGQEKKQKEETRDTVLTTGHSTSDSQNEEDGDSDNEEGEDEQDPVV
jgi:hypothetical protein